ncbi:hypothetical protein G6514_002480 [Epicoccum nigrum]|nr:hypothetical protein G6514_002480 [Epicoccum nigrum]
MAKGLRASSERTNRRKLRTKVFGPVETARAERLHAKLLATINSDKPAPPKNKVANESTFLPPTVCTALALALTDTAAAATEAKDDVEKGSFFLSAPVPPCLSSTRTADEADSTAMRDFCFYLGLSADICGFTAAGDVQFAFDPLPPST